MRLLFVAAAVKIAVGLVVWPAIYPGEPLAPNALPTWYYVGLLLIFGASGVLLYVGGKSDVRARLLGVAFLLFGSLFTDRLVWRALPSIPAPLSEALAVQAYIHLIALEPLVFWQFAWSFPRVQPSLIAPWFPRFMTRAALVAGVILVLGEGLLQLIATERAAFEQLRAWLSPTTQDGYFWQITSLLMVPSLALLVAKLRAAAADERRRLAWVVAGIVLGTFPMVVHVFLVTTISGYVAYVQVPTHSRTIGILLTAFSLVIPAATAYAVLVDQILELRFVIRRAVQYALARYTLLTFMAAVSIGLLVGAYQDRQRPLVDILRSSPLMLLGTALVLALVVWRRPLLTAIDRFFFREHYDARRILVELVDRSQQAQTTREMVRLITSEVDRALHLEHISLLIRDNVSGHLHDLEGRVRDLDLDSALGSLIGGSHAPLDVDLSLDSSPLGRLPERERDWLIDASARLIVPIFGTEGRPLGVLTLGDKRSELAFTPEDRKLMTAVAASAAFALEQRLLTESPGPYRRQSSQAQAGRQCVTCGRVTDRSQPPCRACGGQLREALLPAVLVGNFEIEQQIGAGGMGVVYRARDLSLDRPVAVKVLPRVVPQGVARLRREARAMAIMRHPHLAVIHAMESWRGAPVLILEYLSGGTVADRIRNRPMSPSEIVSLGLIIGDVLNHVHRAGYLHRDIKPSNVGYTDDGIPKLLDFGLVRLVTRLSDLAIADDATTTAGLEARPRPADLGSFATAAHQFVGTPAYLSPEAVAAAPPTQSVDLWGLAITLYEALTGKNPFAAATVAETVSLVARAAVPDPRQARPDCPPALAAFFAVALAADPDRRPQNASDFIKRLRLVE